MENRREFTYPSSAEGRTLYATEWMPPEGAAPRAVLQIAHGVSEHIERYAALGAFLSAQGFAVVGADHLGHGRSAGEQPGYFAPRGGWGHVVRDLHALRLMTSERYPGLPYFLLGHSMGSFLVRSYLIDYPDDGLAGAILSGTGQEAAAALAMGRRLAGLIVRTAGGTKRSPLLRRLSMGAYNRQFAPARTGNDWISRDTAVVDAYNADPFCQYHATAGLFFDMMGGLQSIIKPKHLANMNPLLPVYFFSGDADPVGGEGKGVRRVAEAFRAAGCADVTLKLYPGGRHEMLNEINRNEVFRDLLEWLETKCESFLAPVTGR